MSGDSSGRRPEGRGRGRDPHRDRTRSRSRSRSPLSPGSRRGAAPERREALELPSLEEEEPSDSGDEMDPASLDEEPDQGLCRQIRHQYRALINSVQRKAGRGARVGAGTEHRACAARLLGSARDSAAPLQARQVLAQPSCLSRFPTLAGARRTPLGRMAPPEAGRGADSPEP